MDDDWRVEDYALAFPDSYYEGPWVDAPLFVTYGRVPLLRGPHLPCASRRCCRCVRTGRPGEFPFYERRANRRTPAMVWSRSWLGVRRLRFDRDRALPDVPGFCRRQSSSPGLVVELLIARLEGRKR